MDFGSCRAPIVGRKIFDALSAGMGRGLEEAWAHQAVLGATAKIVGSNAAMAVVPDFWLPRTITGRELTLAPSDSTPRFTPATNSFIFRPGFVIPLPPLHPSLVRGLAGCAAARCSVP